MQRKHQNYILPFTTILIIDTYTLLFIIFILRNASKFTDTTTATGILYPNNPSLDAHDTYFQSN